MNTQRLIELRDYIANLPPERIDMSAYIIPDRMEETVGEAVAASCNTAGCIAGWEALRRLSIEDPYMKLSVNQIYGNGRYVCNNLIGVDAEDHRISIETYAAESLNLTKRQREHLFQGIWHTLSDYGEMVSDDCDNEDECNCRNFPSSTRLKELTKDDVIKELNYCIAHDDV